MVPEPQMLRWPVTPSSLNSHSVLLAPQPERACRRSCRTRCRASGRRRAALALVLANAAAGASGQREWVAAPPPSRNNTCQGGTFLQRLSVPGTTCPGGAHCGDDSVIDSDGPFLEVRGAATPGVDGIYARAGRWVVQTDGAQRLSTEYYVKGHHRLLWESGPRTVYGQRWLLFGGPNASTREAPLYYKYTEDALVGWRGSTTFGSWSVGDAGLEPAPLVESERPEERLSVSGAGVPDADGDYLRDSSLFPKGYKAFTKGSYVLLWEPAPQVSRGYRWVLFREPEGIISGQSQERPYYYRLSEDGEAGYNGAWNLENGLYPPPSVGFVQTTACVRCPPGSYSPPSADSCTRCPTGRYSLGGADQCTACLPGRFADSSVVLDSVRKAPSCGARYASSGQGSCKVDTPGATNCEICAAGRFSGLASEVCEPCPPGFHTQQTGSSSCHACLGGTWSGSGFAKCESCPAGRAHNETNASTPLACELCDAGKYSHPGWTVCLDCSPGSFAADGGKSACTLCPAGSFSATGAGMCEVCSNPEVVVPRGAGQSSC